jgi:NAD(P)H dehydrogenase (quinone)
MPKILVLFHGHTGDTARIADAIAEGARSIRFSEVDVRRIDDPASSGSPDDAGVKHRTLGSTDELPEYDALVFGAPSGPGARSAELEALLGQAGAPGQRGALVNKVGSAFTALPGGDDAREAALWAVMTPMASLGMIIVAPYHGGSGPLDGDAASDAGLAAAREHGKRIADVVAWITHARSHAHSHTHSH